MKSHRHPILAALALVIILAGTASAQNALMDGVRSILVRTDEIIEQASAVVHSSNYPGARIALDAAIKLQDEAWRIFNGVTMGNTGELATVKRLSLEAREQAQKAISAGRTAEQDQSSLLHRLERTVELIDQAREALGDNSVTFGQSVLTSARDNLDRAWEYYRAGRYRIALKLCNQVEQAMRKVIESANENGRLDARYDRRADFVTKGIERAEGMLEGCSSETASGLLDRAREALEQSRELHAQERPGLALKTLQNARKLAEQATRECRGGQSLAQHYERLLAEANSLSEIVPASDAQGHKLLGMAVEQLELASGYLLDGRTASATAALRAAELTLEQLKRQTGDSGT